MKTRAARLGAACALLAGGAAADLVEWSDGRRWEGRIETDPDARLELHDGRQVHAWPLAEIAGIVFTPATQRMERAWHFVEAGRTAKEFSGDPYPTMELEAGVTLRDGTGLRGHLATTVLYLTAGGHTEKLVVKYKLRGRERQTMAELAYPSRITLGAEPAAAPAGGVAGAVVRVAGVGPSAELAAASRERMTVAGVRRRSADGFGVVLDGGDAVAAVRDGGRLLAGWGGELADEPRRRIEQALRDLRDFLDTRSLLAGAQDAGDPTTCHTLLLLSRSGRTTLAATASLPWHLEIWKWRLGAGTNDITAVSRCTLFRGIRGPQDPLPAVVVVPELIPPGGRIADGWSPRVPVSPGR